MGHRASAAGRAFIRGFEQLRLTAYPDSGGVWTIGWGHTGPEVKEGLVITDLWADTLFDRDIAAAEAKLDLRIGDVPLWQGQIDALVSFCYNVKLEPNEQCHLLAYVRDGNFEAAAKEFPRWDHCKGEVIAGLDRRRLAEQRMFMGRAA